MTMVLADHRFSSSTLDAFVRSPLGARERGEPPPVITGCHSVQFLETASLTFSGFAPTFQVPLNASMQVIVADAMSVIPGSFQADFSLCANPQTGQFVALWDSRENPVIPVGSADGFTIYRRLVGNTVFIQNIFNPLRLFVSVERFLGYSFGPEGAVNVAIRFNGNRTSGAGLIWRQADIESLFTPEFAVAGTVIETGGFVVTNNPQGTVTAQVFDL